MSFAERPRRFDDHVDAGADAEPRDALLDPRGRRRRQHDDDGRAAHRRSRRRGHLRDLRRFAVCNADTHQVTRLSHPITNLSICNHIIIFFFIIIVVGVFRNHHVAARRKTALFLSL